MMMICGCGGALAAWRPCSSKPAARCMLQRSIDGTADGRTPDRYVDPAPHSMRTVSITPVIAHAALSLSLGTGAINRARHCSGCIDDVGLN